MINGHSGDPLVAASLPNGQALFAMMSKCANGFPAEAVINAGANLIVNALRQKHARRETAERDFDEVLGRTKQALMDCYDQVGRLRGVYPFDQVINVDFLLDPDQSWKG